MRLAPNWSVERYPANMLRRYAFELREWLFGHRKPPEDPYASVCQPVRRGPPNLRAGVALDEPPPRKWFN
jgi:hypothetical protein